MKKLIFTFAVLAQTAFVFAAENNTGSHVTNRKATVMARYENVKMHRQPGTSTEILKALQSTDAIEYVRPFNQNWSIVLVDGQVGYVLTSEIGQAKTNTKVTFAKK